MAQYYDKNIALHKDYFLEEVETKHLPLSVPFDLKLQSSDIRPTSKRNLNSQN